MSSITITPQLTIVTVLKTGQHLHYSTLLREGDEPALLAQTHALVRDHHHSGHVERFIVIHGTEVQTVEARS